MSTAGWIIIGTAVSWGLIDIWLALTKREAISQKMRPWGRWVSVLIFGMGLLMGHSLFSR